GDRAGRLQGELGDGLRVVAGDATDPAVVERAVSAAASAGPLRVVVACAGGSVTQGIVDRSGQPHPMDGFDRMVAVNLRATFDVLRQGAAAMVAGSPPVDGERGVVVLTGSIAALEGRAGMTAYAATKAAVLALVLPAARDLAAVGIRVVAIAPGAFDTPMLAAGRQGDPPSTSSTEIPFPNRLGHPDEFAALVEHVWQNKYLNGTVLRLDGALRLRSGLTEPG
ncbi:MAG TPA: SDR family NAD(P)-dependent oxidoreductase, partial [Acidimicrobiales bacterium]|nr:SDR family NAD(P)-dependent oxidoreductase [Acidimicrobiales bacterium]